MAGEKKHLNIEHQRVIAIRGSRTQEAFAGAINMSVDNLRKIERGEIGVTLNTARAIHEAEGVSLDYIYGYTDNTDDDASKILLYLAKIFNYSNEANDGTYHITLRKSVVEFLENYRQATDLYESGKIPEAAYIPWIEKLKADLNGSFKSEGDTDIEYTLIESKSYLEIERRLKAEIMKDTPRPR